jgi:dihydropyrimidinase
MAGMISMHDQIYLAIKGEQIVTPAGVISDDIGIKNRLIHDIGSNLPPATTTIDASGKWVMSGGIDPNAPIEQMSDMDVMKADTFETATRSAAMDGTTCLISFAAKAKGQTLAYAVTDDSARYAGCWSITPSTFHNDRLSLCGIQTQPKQ